MYKRATIFFTFIVFSLVIFLAGCLPKKSVEQPTKVEEAQKTFTLQELSRYDGKQGQPAYVAVDGIVYDVSQIFKEGAHYEHLAGKELTKEFYSRHVKEEIEKYPVVGKLIVTSSSPSEVVSAYMRHTLGTLPEAQIDYEQAKQYLAPQLRAQFTDDSFVPRSYGIQDGPQRVSLSAEEISGNSARVTVDAFYGTSMAPLWEFELILSDNQWKIGQIRNISG